MANPRSENLDRRVTVQRYVETPGSQGDVIKTWQSLVTVWAGRSDVSTLEQFRAKEVGAELSTRFVVRYTPESKGIDPKDRIVEEDGSIYEITGRKIVARNQWIELDAVRRDDK